MKTLNTCKGGVLYAMAIGGCMLLSSAAMGKKNLAPIFAGGTPDDSTTLQAKVGQPFSFTVAGKDVNFAIANNKNKPIGDSVMLTSTALPGTATMTPALPMTVYMGSPNTNLSTQFDWTPTIADTGLHMVSFTLADNASPSLSTVRTVFIDVTADTGCNLMLSPFVTDVLCDSLSGAIDMTILNGTAPFTITWSTGDSVEDLSGLMVGDYIVTVTDSNNCTVTDTFTVDALTADISVSPASIVKNGVATLYDKHGPQSADLSVDIDSLSGYVVSWTPITGITDPSASMVSVSPDSTTTYVVTVTDTVANCFLSDTITINVVNVGCVDGKVKVCHSAGNSSKSITLCLDSAAVAAHLAHGDQLGDCDTTSPKFGGGNEFEEGVLDIYPNPSVDGSFMVKIPEVAEEAKMVITDLNGRVILNKPTTKGNQFVDLTMSNVPKGIYLIQVISGKDVYRSKLYVE